MKKRLKIVVSGINITEAGPLSIMRDFLSVISHYSNETIEVIALVHSKSLYDVDNIHFIEFPKSKTSWFKRLYYEYFYFRKFSKKLHPDYWISMHDMTPNVYCKKQFVYCHNVTPYYTPSWKDWLYGPRASLFSLFYIYLYSINIRRNHAVIVQQDWFRNALIKRFRLSNVIVAYPDTKPIPEINIKSEESNDKIRKVFYPTFPRSFKNIEVICEAYLLLSQSEQENLEVYLTIDNSLNRYSSYLYEKYGGYKNIKFIGLINRDEVYRYYNKVDALVFPSKLESWGLPITEFKQFNKPIFLSDLPYARETLGCYEQGYFFDPNSKHELSILLSALVRNDLKNNKVEIVPKIKPPFIVGWKNLYDYILQGA